MTNKQFSIPFLVAVALMLSAGPATDQAHGQDCASPGKACPVIQLFTDGVFHSYGSVCCTPNGPACLMNQCTSIGIFNAAVNGAAFGCEADPLGPGSCKCKCGASAGSVGDGAAGAELTFNPDNATAINISNGTCDSYFVKVDGEDAYYRCYNLTFNYSGNPHANKYTIRATKQPTNFTVQTYATTRATVNGVQVLQVQVPSGGGTTQATFAIAKKAK